MIVSCGVLKNHLEYSVWADKRCLEAATSLSEEELAHDFKTNDQSVFGTLRHIYKSEHNWLSRLGREKLLVEGLTHPPGTDIHLLAGQWAELHSEWLSWASELSAESASEVVHYFDNRGNSRSSLVWHIVLHVVNHSSHHRGQVSGFLRALGHTPRPLDFIGYMREGIPATQLSQ